MSRKAAIAPAVGRPAIPARRNPARPAQPNPLWHWLATRPRIQAKLTIGAPNDPYEREADQVADQVMRMPEPAVQKKCAHCEEEEKVQTTPQRTLEVRRSQFQDCTEDEINQHIQPSLNGADAYLDDAIAELGNRPLTALAQGALWLAFRSDTEATAEMVKGTLEAIKAGLKTSWIECDRPDDYFYDYWWTCKDRYAYVPGPGGAIHLCMGEFPHMTSIRKAYAMIHEGGHRYAYLVGDPGYMTSQCEETGKTALLSPSQRFANADSYSCFVYHIKHTRNVPARADAYKGKNLKLVQEPAGVIDLNAEETSTRFRMKGAPDLSGFRYRWVIADSEDNSYLMKAAKGDPFMYGRFPEVWIGTKTRARLKEMGITSAEVRCRVNVPQVGEPLFTLPVTFTS